MALSREQKAEVESMLARQSAADEATLARLLSELTIEQKAKIASQVTTELSRAESPSWLAKLVKDEVVSAAWKLAAGIGLAGLGAWFLVGTRWIGRDAKLQVEKALKPIRQKQGELETVISGASERVRAAARETLNAELASWRRAQEAVVETVRQNAQATEGYLKQTEIRSADAREQAVLAKVRADSVVEAANKLDDAKIRSVLEAADHIAKQNSEFAKRVANIVKKDVKKQAELLPIGTVIGVPYEPSEGQLGTSWKACKGQVLSNKSEEYDTLVELLGTKYGVAKNKSGKVLKNGVKLPDFRGCFLRGFGTARDRFGEERAASRSDGIGELQEAGLPELAAHIMGGFDKPWLHYARVKSAQWQPSSQLNGREDVRSGRGAVGHGVPVRPVNPAQENRPVNYAVYWIIRVK